MVVVGVLRGRRSLPVLLEYVTAFLGRLQTLTSLCIRANLDEGTDGAIHVCQFSHGVSFPEFARAGQHIPTPSPRFRS